MFLAVISFFESFIFPIPPDIALVPMCLANKRKSFLYATITTIGSVLGGIIGYLIGSALWSSFGSYLINFYGYSKEIASFKDLYNEHGSFIVLVGGLTPVPYKVVTILSGVTGLSFSVFVTLSFLSRGLRFFFIAFLIYIFGDKINLLITRHINIIFLSTLLIMLGGYQVFVK